MLITISCPASKECEPTRIWATSVGGMAIPLILGIYVLRTKVKKEVLSAEDAVVTCKSLSQVERPFRSMKGMY